MQRAFLLFHFPYRANADIIFGRRTDAVEQCFNVFCKYRPDTRILFHIGFSCLYIRISLSV